MSLHNRGNPKPSILSSSISLLQSSLPPSIPLSLSFKHAHRTTPSAHLPCIASVILLHSLCDIATAIVVVKILSVPKPHLSASSAGVPDHAILPNGASLERERERDRGRDRQTDRERERREARTKARSDARVHSRECAVCTVCVALPYHILSTPVHIVPYWHVYSGYSLSS